MMGCVLELMRLTMIPLAFCTCVAILAKFGVSLITLVVCIFIVIFALWGLDIL